MFGHFCLPGQHSNFCLLPPETTCILNSLQCQDSKLEETRIRAPQRGCIQLLGGSHELSTVKWLLLASPVCSDTWCPTEHKQKTHQENSQENRQKIVTGFTFSRPDLQWIVELYCQGKGHWGPEWDLVFLANWINSSNDSTWMWADRESTLKNPFVFSEGSGP